MQRKDAFGLGPQSEELTEDDLLNYEDIEEFS